MNRDTYKINRATVIIEDLEQGSQVMQRDAPPTRLPNSIRFVGEKAFGTKKMTNQMKKKFFQSKASKSGLISAENTLPLQKEDDDLQLSLLKPTAKTSNNELLEASPADKDSELSTRYEGTSCGS